MTRTVLRAEVAVLTDSRRSCIIQLIPLMIGTGDQRSCSSKARTFWRQAIVDVSHILKSAHNLCTVYKSLRGQSSLVQNQVLTMELS